MTKANECTCPSGAGSLRWPCPKHPAVEHERAEFEAWVRRDWPGAPLRFIRDALTVNDPRYGQYCDDALQRAWVGWQARAALAQPSPVSEALIYACKNLAQITSSDGSGHADIAMAVLRMAGVGDDERERLVNEWKAARAWKPSPAQAEQAEAERPIVSFEKYMQVMYDRDENAKRLDAALARVAELEKQEPVATVAKVPGEDWNSLDFHRELQDMHPGTKLYAAPVAQAQPEETPGEILAAKLIETWVTKHGKPAPWSTAVEITALATNMPNDERDRLLALDDDVDAQAQHSVPGNAAALVRAEGKKYSLNAAGMLDSGAPEHAQTFAIVQLLSEFDDEEAESHWEAIMAYSDFRTSDALFHAAELLAAAPGKSVPQAWLDVQAERRRQIEAEGWTPEHDDKHNGGELADAAACYALWAGGINPGNWREFWPWAPEWLRHSEPRRMLVKAGALILAEIERLDRGGAPC
ncbi:TPA: hypothetical protein ACGJWW_006583 [Pseudomonas aeruginosa]|uniref:hypothetical protein n=1 Tax=Pseudomonas aeruginosa TaxID=287 RepID=UPI000A42AA3D|nr:hypothetical protein [Pseudomonas aeruginosa]